MKRILFLLIACVLTFTPNVKVKDGTIIICDSLLVES